MVDLPNLGLVTSTRQGRSVLYTLYDDHVAELLDQDPYHMEHLDMGLGDAVPEVAAAVSEVEPITEPISAAVNE
ncbi:helix-turn-helix domain-containing protein [Actinomadura montaniterrae]|uniref:helix-turn-helix domain-containing protein n=1 Tax=Actinomadura montaniterrae TaxID=1803903 RepID=UPI0029901801|nr:helix-turn-helix domain-containing protein [Actinomadura montaniterrae]